MWKTNTNTGKKFQSNGNGIDANTMNDLVAQDGKRIRRSSYLHFGDSFIAKEKLWNQDRPSQADIRYSKDNKKYQVYANNHPILSRHNAFMERWFDTRKEAETFAKTYVTTKLFDKVDEIRLDPSMRSGFVATKRNPRSIDFIIYDDNTMAFSDGYLTDAEKTELRKFLRLRGINVRAPTP